MQLPGRCLTRLPFVNRIPEATRVRVGYYIRRSIAANQRRRSGRNERRERGEDRRRKVGRLSAGQSIPSSARCGLNRFRATLHTYLYSKRERGLIPRMGRAGGFKAWAAAPSGHERRSSRLSPPREVPYNLLKINDLQKKFRFFQKGVDSAETLNYVLAPRRRSLIGGGPRGSGKRRAVRSPLPTKGRHISVYTFRGSRSLTKEAISGAFCGPPGPADFVHRCIPRRDAQAVVRRVTCST